MRRPGNKWHSPNPPTLVIDAEPLDGPLPTPCLVWRWGKTGSGYGRLYVNGIGESAHRYFYRRAGHELRASQHLDHLCRNPACVNPEHLEIVTPAENTRRGKKAKLTAIDVEYIRVLKDLGISARDLGDAFGVSKWTVFDVTNGKSWQPPGRSRQGRPGSTI